MKYLLYIDELRRRLRGDGPYHGMNFGQLKDRFSNTINACYDKLMELPIELQQHVIGSGMDDHGAFFTINVDAPSKHVRILKDALKSVDKGIYFRRGVHPRML